MNVHTLKMCAFPLLSRSTVDETEWESDDAMDFHMKGERERASSSARLPLIDFSISYFVFVLSLLHAYPPDPLRRHHRNRQRRFFS